MSDSNTNYAGGPAMGTGVLRLGVRQGTEVHVNARTVAGKQ